MKVNIEQTSAVERKLNIEIPWDRVVAERDRQYGLIRGKARIKGFRPGKAPMEMIRQLYAKEAHDDAVQALAVQAIQDALRENSLDPFGNPYITDIRSEADQPLQVEAMVELPPAFELADFRGLEVQKAVFSVSDADVDRFLGSLRERSARAVPLAEDRPLKDGDLAVLDYAGSQGGNAVPGLSAEGFKVRMGRSELLPGFEEQIVGLRKGQSREFDLAFPQDYPNPKLAGQGVRFSVTLKDIQGMEVPPLDEAFAKGVGGFESVEALRAAVRDNMARTREAESQRSLRAEVARKLVDANPFEVPPSLVDKELRFLVQDFGDTLLSAGIPQEKVKERILASQEELKKSARDQVRLMFVIREISEREGLAATDEEVERAVSETALRLGRKKEELLEQYGADGTLAEIGFRLVRDKVFERVLSTARVREVEGKPEDAA